MADWTEEKVNNPTFSENGEEIVNPATPNWLVENTGSDPAILSRLPQSLPLRYEEGGMYSSAYGFLFDVNSSGTIIATAKNQFKIINKGSFIVEPPNVAGVDAAVDIRSYNYIGFDLRGSNYFNETTSSIGVKPSFIIGFEKSGTTWTERWLEYERERDILSLNRLGYKIKTFTVGAEQMPLHINDVATYIETLGSGISLVQSHANQSSLNFGLFNNTSSNPERWFGITGTSDGAQINVRNAPGGTETGILDLYNVKVTNSFDFSTSSISGTNTNMLTWLGISSEEIIDWSVSQTANIHPDNYTNNVYAVVDINHNGLAPQLPNPYSGQFLKGDGSWGVPSYNTFNDASAVAAINATTGITTTCDTPNVQANWSSLSGASQILNKPNIEYTSAIPEATSSQTGLATSTQITKLDAIEDDATTDQTGAEIKIAYEGEADTNAFTDAKSTKLFGIATGANVNVKANWSSTTGDSEILNKPVVMNSSNSYAIGLVPAGNAVHAAKYLRQDGQWQEVSINVSDGTNTTTIKPSETITFTAGAATTVTESNGTVTIAGSDTTYSVMGSGNSYAIGLVPSGSAINANEFLRKDGLWVNTGWTLSDGSNGTGIAGGTTITVTGTGATTATVSSGTLTIDSTNTEYSAMGSGNSYALGLVPAGASLYAGEFLAKDGTWRNTSFIVNDSDAANNYNIGAGSTLKFVGAGATTITNTPGTLTTTISSANDNDDVTIANLGLRLSQLTSTNIIIGATDTTNVEITGTINFKEVAYFHSTTTTQVASNVVEVDWDKSNKCEITFASTDTGIDFTTNPPGKCNLLMMITQPASGATVAPTWAINAGSIKWAGGSAPTLSTGVGDIDIVTFYYDGTDFYGMCAKDFA